MKDTVSEKCLNTEDIYDVVYGEASENVLSGFADHIKICEKCKREYESIKKIKSVTDKLNFEPSSDFTNVTLERIRNVRKKSFINIIQSRTFKIVSTAACLVIMLICCYKFAPEKSDNYIERSSDITRVLSANSNYSLPSDSSDFVSYSLASSADMYSAYGCDEDDRTDFEDAMYSATVFPSNFSHSEDENSELHSFDSLNSPNSSDSLFYFPTDLIDEVKIISTFSDEGLKVIECDNGIVFTIINAEDFGEIVSFDDSSSEKNLENDVYIGDIGDDSFKVCWFAESAFYELSLPLSYKDGNEIRFTDLTLIDNIP